VGLYGSKFPKIPFWGTTKLAAQIDAGTTTLAYDMTKVEEVDGKRPFDRLTRTLALVALAIALPFFFLFASFGEPAKGRAAAISVGMIVAVIWMRWDLRKRLWLWITIAIWVLLHVPLVLLVPWSNTNYPGVVLLPQALLDLAVVYGCIKLIEKVMKRSDKATTSC
jgi:hypothetical protein